MPFVPVSMGAALRVLVADDSHEVADLTGALIGLALPCEVAITYGGFDALQHARASRPDVVVLDLNMPGIDGIEVARRIRDHYPDDPPYCIALTGDANATRDLGEIDRQFDRAFAKPLDVDQLIAVLARLASGDASVVHAERPVDLAELFTRAARQVVPLADHLSFSFDYRGPCVIVHGDPTDVQCGLHRLLLGAVDMLTAGFVLFSADSTLDETGHCSIVVRAAGTGPLRPASTLDAVIRRLRLVGSEAALAAPNPPRTASGVCPNTGAPVTFSSDPREGILLRTDLTYEGAIEVAGSRSASAPGARAWVVDHGGLSSDWLQRRLQRLGWRVTRFASCAQAMRHATGDTGTDASRSPSLLVVIEGLRLPVLQAEALQRVLPPSTQCVLAVMAGSARLGSLDAPACYELRVYPFSPMELADFCALASPSTSHRAAATVPAALGLRDRPVVLIVDDNEINRIVGRGLVEALGYEARTANDGLDAIDRCRREPPRVVLMDLDMPVLNGIDATRRIRDLQRSGEIAPFPIVAATADATAEAACMRAGVDGYLSKPIRLSELREQLRRFTDFP